MDLGFNFQKLCSILLVLSLAANVDATNSVVFNVKKFGAVADGKTDDAKAFLSAWKEACNSIVKGKVLVPKGTYLVSFAKFEGPCKAPIAFSVHGVVKALPGLSNVDKESWITFQYINRLRLIGGGVFHGQGSTAWALNECAKNSNCKLPISLRFNFLNKSTIEGIQSVGSKLFHINVLGCNNLKMKSLDISAPKDSPNTDGIHIGQSNGIEISDSVIGTGDDCISLGQGSNNVYISNVFCGPGHGISVGSLGKSQDDEVFGLTVRNCTFTGTDNGVRIKTWPDSNNGAASNFTFEDIVMNNVQNPIVIDQLYCPYANCKAEVPSRIKVSNVRFNNIKGTSSSKVAVSLVCSKSFPCRNVEIGNINLVNTGVDGPAVSSCSNVKPILTGKQVPAVCV